MSMSANLSSSEFLSLRMIFTYSGLPRFLIKGMSAGIALMVLAIEFVPLFLRKTRFHDRKSCSSINPNIRIRHVTRRIS